MIDEAKMTELSQAEDMAYFRADFCLYSPESYTLEEKRDICNDMMATSKAVLDAMREDFEQMPPDARAMLSDMLCASGVESPSGGGTCSWEKETRTTANSNPRTSPSPHSKQGGRLSRR